MQAGPVAAELDLGTWVAPPAAAVARDPEQAQAAAGRAARAYAIAVHSVVREGGSGLEMLTVPGVPEPVGLPTPAWAGARAAGAGTDTATIRVPLGIDTYERVEGSRVYIAMFFSSARLPNDQVEAYCGHVFLEANPAGGVRVGVQELPGKVLVPGTSRKTSRVACPYGPLADAPEALS